MSDPIVIVSAARTPIGAMMGELSWPRRPAARARSRSGPRVERAGIKAAQVQEVIMGCVLPAGQGQAPARQATLGAGLPLSAGATTLNKVCGSGMKSAMLAHDLLIAGSQDIVVAGGMESMSNAPYLMLKGRGGYRYGHATCLRPHGARRPRRRLREDAQRRRQVDGTVRRGLRGEVHLHAAKQQDAVRDRVDAPRAARRTTTAASRGRSRRSRSPAARATS